MSKELSTDVRQKPTVVAEPQEKLFTLEELIEARKFTFEELVEVWYFSMIHGATLWQYCQDTNKKLPDDFMRGLDGIKDKLVTPLELQEVLKSRALMVGLFDELSTTNTTSDTPIQE